MHRFRHESWVRKLENSHPRGWSTSGGDYGDFHDPSTNLEWKKSDRTACVDPPRSWSPDNYHRSVYQTHFQAPRRAISPGPWTYKESIQPKRGVASYKPGLRNPKSRIPRLPPIHDEHVHWVVRENQRQQHPHFHAGSRDIFDFKFHGRWMPVG